MYTHTARRNMLNSARRAAAAAAVLVLALGTGACESLTGPDGPPVEIRLLGQAELPAGMGVIEWFEAPPRVEAAAGGPGQVVVNGDFLFALTYVRMTAETELSDGTLVIEVDYEQEGTALDQWMGEYEVRVSELPPASYTVVVKHRIEWFRHSLPEGMTEVHRSTVVVE